MVSQNSNPEPSIPQQFITSYSMTSQPQLWNLNCAPYPHDLSSTSSAYPSLGLLPSIYSLGERMSRAIDLVHSPQVSRSRHLMDLLEASSDANEHAQKLSLSLGSRTLGQCRETSLNQSSVNQGFVNPGMGCFISDYSLAGCAFSSSSTSISAFSETESFTAIIANSKYLRPAQSLLEEVVRVGGKAADSSNEKYIRRLSRNGKKGSLWLRSMLSAEFPNNELSNEKHELHAKIMKLIALLEEVERRYEQYFHQMEEILSSFEAIAGLGTGKSYTALALQAMSKYFCSLREAITSQINSVLQKISEEMPKVISAGLSPLSVFDRDTRLRKMFLQQLGMIQSSRQAWRPIRGLPETSVAILRAWLFEHFLHPYPNDSEKLLLASQTGLTKNQVSNWFINARVRLWKPMIEEMYRDEFADSSAESDPLLGSSATSLAVTDSAEE